MFLEGSSRFLLIPIFSEYLHIHYYILISIWRTKYSELINSTITSMYFKSYIFVYLEYNLLTLVWPLSRVPEASNMAVLLGFLAGITNFRNLSSSSIFTVF